MTRTLKQSKRIKLVRRDAVPTESISLDVDTLHRESAASSRPRFFDLRESIGRKPTLSEIDGDWE